MSQKTYLLKNVKNRMNYHTVEYGMTKLGMEVVPVDSISEVDFREPSYFYGGAGFISKVKESLNLQWMDIAHVPPALYPYAGGRRFEEMTLIEAIALAKTQKVFFKPLAKQHKVFTGQVLDSSNLINVAHLPDDLTVVVSDVVDMRAEYRCFIHEGEIVDYRHYIGDFTRYPVDFYTVRRMIADWKDAPVAYSLDVAVTPENNTIIVECNDVMCLGWYGIHPILAANMLISRWEQIYKDNSHASFH